MFVKKNTRICWWRKIHSLIYTFYLRLGAACTQVTDLLFKLQACTLLDLNKVASSSKLCAWNKSRKQVETTPLVDIYFNRLKGDELVSNVVPNHIDELRPFCTVDPVENLAKLRQKLLELKQIAHLVCVNKYIPWKWWHLWQ